MKKTILILFSVICIFTLFLFVVFNFVIYPTKYKNHVVAYAVKFNLEPALVYAVIKTESNFDKNATSSSGAMGLMQLIPTTAKWIAGEFDEIYDETNVYNPETNIKYGCFYLNYLYEKFTNMEAVICAYNAGEGVVKNWINEKGEVVKDKISYSETRNYLKKVIGYYNIYKNHEICE